MKNIQLKSNSKGEIILVENVIKINDRSANMNKAVFIIYPLIFLFLAIYQIYSGIISESGFQITLRILSGIFLLSIPAFSYHSNFFRSNKKEIELNEIKNVKMKKIFGEILIDFNLKNNSTRRVYNVKNMSDWNVLKSFLIEKNINCLN